MRPAFGGPDQPIQAKDPMRVEYFQLSLELVPQLPQLPPVLRPAIRPLNWDLETDVAQVDCFDHAFGFLQTLAVGWQISESGQGECTYRVEQNHSLVHDLEEVGHLQEVVVKLAYQVRHLGSFDLDDEWVGQRPMLRWDDQIVLLRNQHLNEVNSVAKIMFPGEEWLLFDDLIDGCSDLGTRSTRCVVCVALLLLVKSVASRGSRFLSLDDEVGAHCLLHFQASFH